MQFLVIGVDGPSFGPGVLDEAHWSYMDGFADRLVARGPTLSPDGEEHTGSVHVVDLPDREAAEAFAAEEPFARAGWYASVSVEPVEPCLAGTMWDRPASGSVSSLVLAATSATAGAVSDRLGSAVPWVYVGVTGRGLVAIVDLAPEAAASVVRDLPGVGGVADVADVADVAAQRWQRGGRPG